MPIEFAVDSKEIKVGDNLVFSGSWINKDEMCIGEGKRKLILGRPKW